MRPLHLRRNLSAFAIIGLLLTAAGCGGTAAPASSSTSGSAAATGAAAKPTPLHTVTVAQGTEPRSLDGNNDSTTAALNIYLSIYDALTARNTAGDLVPGLATAWKADGDTAWVFTLRQGVKFQNGDPFTADDVVFTMNRIMNTKDNPQQDSLKNVTAVTKVDDNTVRFTTSVAIPVLPETLTGIPIVPAKYTQSSDQALANHPVGTGPFMFSKYTHGEELDLVANPNYWGGAPKIGKLVFLFMPDANARVDALKTGQADIISNLPPELVSSIQSSPGLTVKTQLSNREINILLDETYKPFSDQQVRQALNYAVNVDSIIKNVLGGDAVREPTMVPTGFVGSDPSLQPYPYDPAKAKQLLAAAGYGSGLSLTLQSPNGRYLKDSDVSQAVAADLTTAGVKTTVQTYEWGNYVNQYFAHKLGPMFLIGNGSYTADACDNFSNILGSDPYSWFHDPALDKQINTACATVDQTQRAALYQQIQKQVYTLAPVLFLYTEKDIYGMNAKLNWTPRRDEIIWLGDASLQS